MIVPQLKMGLTPGYAISHTPDVVKCTVAWWLGFVIPP
jgi:hypothetical protein